MHRLLLLRHAKAGWPKPGMRDFDRPLLPAGVAAARAVGRRMLAAGLLPDRVLCSSSLRTRQTWHWVAGELGATPAAVEFSDSLYATDVTGYLDAIRGAGPARTLLVVGHNPNMEDLALALPGDGDPQARAALVTGFPTAALAVLAFAGPLAAAAPGEARLEAFLVPPAGG
ncbi:histidine phosphatase family protein [Aquibium sp. A9E412]|uniref:SixA phosphatase family protein n=1 Tax=Aquibium sp. A9E412 TaxID=2976767 RepID=UPI0025AFA484|nr:histidine phosphatase family protein [Aquibium sp. A9E412]MDN2568281.1 histidine phosphatase family protein [Aquibium sp. A9E412]